MILERMKKKRVLKKIWKKIREDCLVGREFWWVQMFSPEPTKILSLPFWEILKIGKERSLDKISKLPLLLCVNITCWFFFSSTCFLKQTVGLGFFFMVVFFFNLFIKWWLSKWYILLFLKIVCHILEWLYWVQNQIRSYTKVFFFFFWERVSIYGVCSFDNKEPIIKREDVIDQNTNLFFM